MPGPTCASAASRAAVAARVYNVIWPNWSESGITLLEENLSSKGVRAELRRQILPADKAPDQTNALITRNTSGSV